MESNALPIRGLGPAYGFLDPTLPAHGRSWRKWFRLRGFHGFFDAVNTAVDQCTGIDSASRIRLEDDGHVIQLACIGKVYLLGTGNDLPSLGIADGVSLASID